jgi:alpha-mannosidase
MDLITDLNSAIEQLRSRSQLSLLAGWQRQDAQNNWQTLEVTNSQKNMPMIAFLKQEQDIHIRQIWRVPEVYAGIDTSGAAVYLHLTWWVDWCVVFINGQQVQEGDLFDQKCRLLLSDCAAGQEFVIELKLNSPKHDIGALQRSHIVLEYAHQACDPQKFADELAVLQVYLPILIREQIDIQPLKSAIAALNELLVSQIDKEQKSLFSQLAAIREPLLKYGKFLKERQIYLLGNSHIDVAWLWAIAETKQAMQRTFSSALHLQKSYPELIFNQSTALSYQWMEQEAPELFKQIQQAVAEGKWELIGGMWVEPDGNLPSGESLIRQILYGQAYFREKFDQEVKIAWLPDTFGFHWQMPQILAKSGFTAFVTQKLLWNDTNKFPYQIFWWEGVDGSQILTYFSNEIGQGIEPVAIAKYLARQEELHGIQKTVWLYGVGDHGGGPTADMLNQGRQWADAPMFFSMQNGTLAGFLADLKIENASYASSVPVWQDELYLEFHRGTYTTKADQKRQNRQSEILLGNAEKYSAIAALVANINYPMMELETAWQGLLLNQFHDILPGTSIPEVFVDADRTWKEIRDICHKILPKPPMIETQGTIQAWNFLNWQRSQLVQMPDQTLRWLTVPSCGFVNLAKMPPITANLPLSLTSDANHFFLENNFLKVAISRHSGDIAQIWYQRSPEQSIPILRSPSCWQFFSDRGQYWNAWNIDPNYEQHPLEPAILQSITTDENKFLITVKISKTFQKSKFTQEIQISAFEPFITIKNWVDWQEDHVLVKAAFPVNWRSPEATYEIPMATIARRTIQNDSVNNSASNSQDRAKWEVPAQYWADLSAADQSMGLSVLNDCKYGYDAKPDCLRLTLLRSPNWACPQSDRGEHEFTYRLVPHLGAWHEDIIWEDGNSQTISKNIVQLAQELNNPITLYASSFPTPDRLSHSFLETSAPNIILSAWKRSQDQTGWIIRLYEATGKATETNVSIPNLNSISQSISVYECDLMERKIDSEIITSSSEFLTFTIQFTAYEIKTFVISDSTFQNFNPLQSLQQKLISLQQAIANHADPDPSIAKAWARSLEEILHFFQSAIVNSNSVDLGLQVEIDKQLKMLSVDLSMLQSARKLDTWQKRHRQAGDRLTLLLRYCLLDL